MQAGFAAVRARPRGLGPMRRTPVRLGVVVDLPRSREQRLDVLGREEIRRAVRAVEDADLPSRW